MQNSDRMSCVNKKHFWQIWQIRYWISGGKYNEILIEKKDGNETVAQDVEMTKDDAQNDSPKEEIKNLQTDAENAKQNDNKVEEKDAAAWKEEYSATAWLTWSKHLYILFEYGDNIHYPIYQL